MHLHKLSKPSLTLPEVVDRTGERLELPSLIVLGAHAHGVGWRHVVRLWFAGTARSPERPARRPIVADVGGRDPAERQRALAETFAGGGVTKIEIWAVRKL